MNFFYLVANLDNFSENVGCKREKVKFIMQKNRILENINFLKSFDILAVFANFPIYL
jgi:hypothetical protein